MAYCIGCKKEIAGPSVRGTLSGRLMVLSELSKRLEEDNVVVEVELCRDCALGKYVTPKAH